MISIKKPIAKLHKSETRLGLEVKKKTAAKRKSTKSKTEKIYKISFKGSDGYEKIRYVNRAELREWTKIVNLSIL